MPLECPSLGFLGASVGVSIGWVPRGPFAVVWGPSGGLWGFGCWVVEIGVLGRGLRVVFVRCFVFGVRYQPLYWP